MGLYILFECMLYQTCTHCLRHILACTMVEGQYNFQDKSKLDDYSPHGTASSVHMEKEYKDLLVLLNVFLNAKISHYHKHRGGSFISYVFQVRHDRFGMGHLYIQRDKSTLVYG